MAAYNGYNPYNQQQQQPEQQQQLVPHYGPNYDPYGLKVPNQSYYPNYNTAYPPSYAPQDQQQVPSPPAAPTSPQDNGIPSVITTDSPINPSSVIVPPSAAPPVEQQQQEEDDIPDDIVASQARAWEEARSSSRSPPGTTRTLTNYDAERQLVVPKSKNPTGSDSVHPNKQYMKSERQFTTAAAATGGALIGGIITGPVFPVGMVVGGAISGYSANKLHKQGERRAQRKWEQSNFQKGVLSSPINKKEPHTLV
eukprot:scaffold22613_cov126-Cylindrotheca_fusiformis.AAC.12